MNDWQSFYEKISDIKFTMLVTRDAAGTMRARPFTTQAAGRDGAVWFFTRCDAEAIADVEKNNQVLLCYANPDDHQFISVAGSATQVIDRTLVAEWWKPEYKAYFAGGMDDPALVLLRVDVAQADIWDAKQSKMQKLMDGLKSVAGADGHSPIADTHEVLKK